MAKGKQQKQQKTGSSASSAREGEAQEAQEAQEARDAPGGAASTSEKATETSLRPEPVATGPYDREPESGGGALVFLAIIAVLLAGAIAVGLLQAS